MRRPVLTGLLLLILVFSLYPGEPETVVHIIPGVTVPLGSSNEWFNAGFGTSLYADALFPYRFPLLAGTSLNYSFVSTASDYGVNILKINGHVGAYYEPTPRLIFRGFGILGYAHGFSGSGSGANSGGVNLGLGLDSRFMVHPDWDLGFNFTWESVPGLYSGLFFGVSVGYAVTGDAQRNESIRLWNDTRIDLMDVKTPRPGEGLELMHSDIRPIFPAFYGEYDSTAIGEASLASVDKDPLRDVTVTFRIPEYMETDFTCASVGEMQTGENLDTVLFGLLNSSILEVSETTDVSGLVSVTFSRGRHRYRQDIPLAVTILDRNSLTWDDDCKIAAFVSPRGAAVQAFSTSANSAVSGYSSPGLDEHTAMAAAIYAGLRSESFVYQTDPDNPFGSTGTGAVDFVQYPFQTLEYGGGDCDDLTVLYCALLEAAGIPTAMITVPGHILPVYDTGIPENSAGRYFSDETRLLFRGGTVWVPVEMTLRDVGFVEAWNAAAAQVDTASRRGTLAFLPLAESWQSYPPVALPEPFGEYRTPEHGELLQYLSRDIQEMADRELNARLARIERTRRPNTPARHNSFGAVYAGYGRYGDAEREFLRALELGGGDYVPALVNLGNLAFILQDSPRAAGWYRQALALDPENPGITASLAKVDTPEIGTRQVLVVSSDSKGDTRASQVVTVNNPGAMEWMESE